MHSALVLQEKNLELIAVASEIFGFMKGISWEKLRETISDEQVKTFYEYYAQQWPIQYTDVFSTLPAPTTRLRSLYIGDVNPQRILRNILRYSLYNDEIVIVNPLHHPHSMNPEFSPIENPGQHKQDTLEMLYMLVSLSPWIQEGIIHLIPNPIDFDPVLRQEIWSMAEKRVTERPLTLSDLEKTDLEFEGKEMLLRSMTRATPEQQTAQYRSYKPEATDKEIASFISYLNEEMDRHPLWLKQPLPEGGELIVKRMGANLEAGLLLGQATGSYLFTNRRTQWNEILSTRQSVPESEIWSPLTNSFQQLDFKFLDNLDPKFVYRMQQEGRLSNLRSYLRRLWNGLNSQTTESQVREFNDELHEEYSKAKEEWKEIDQHLRTAILSKDGLSSAFWGAMAGGVAGLSSGSLDWKLPIAGFCLPAVNALLQSRDSRKKYNNTVPLSVFVELNNK